MKLAQTDSQVLPVTSATSADAVTATVGIAVGEKNRISAIDFTKGTLVVAMIVYHTLNYSTWRRVPGQFMAFLPPSFILIAGLLVTSIYTVKYPTGNADLYRRLLMRGLKLVILFTFLNVLANGLFSRNYNGQELALKDFFANVGGVYLFGGMRKSAFEILLPIGYLLIVAPIFLRLHFIKPELLPTVAAILFVACIWKERAGVVWPIADMFVVGVIGLAAGQIPIKRWEAFARNWRYILAAYVLYWICRIPFGQIYPMQVYAACVTVLLVFAWAIRLEAGTLAVQEINRLGRYSLLAYIAQIAVLQFLYRARLFDGSAPLHVVWLGTATLVLTWLSVYGVDFLRPRFRLLDSVYRTVFG